MKKIIPCLVAGIALGAGGMLGVTQIPSVKSSLFKDTNSYENLDLEAENSDLKLNNSILQEDVDRLNSELLDCNNLIKQKDETISSHIAKIDQLTTEKAQLQAELDSYKNSSDAGSDNSDIIANLQSQLELKSSELNVATAELEQLRVDKISLETRVQELLTELDEVQEELKKFKDNENIDSLNVSSYNGTWYLDGTFEKVYTIKDGVVTLNSNEDSGVVQCLYNQMYLFMNAGPLAVNLSEDGNSFETADGEIFKRFYINTTETVLSNYTFAGTYSYSNEKIELRADNTLIYSIDDNTYYGAYTVVAQQRNIGGNIVVIDTITANIQVDDNNVVKEFKHSSNDISSLLCGDIVYSQLESYSSLTILKEGTSIPSKYYKIRIKTSTPLKIEPGVSYSLKFLVLDPVGTSGLHRSFNGFTTSVNSVVSLIAPSNVDVGYYSFFDLYMTDAGSYWNMCKISSFYSFGGIVCDIVSVENVGMTNPLFGEMLDIYNSSKSTETFKIECSPVHDYIDGTYSNSVLSISLEGSVSSIVYSGAETITASSVDISAITDGYDIYQDVVITYTRLEIVDEVDTEVVHTITLKFKNDSLISSLLDDELLEL